MSSSRSRCSWVVSSFRRQHCLFCFAQHLYSPSSLITNCRCLNLKSCLSIFLAQHFESLCSLVTCLDCLNRSWFVLLNTSSHSSLRPFVSIFLAVFFSTFRQHFDSLCSLLSCPWQLSKYPYFLPTGSCNVLSPLPTKAPSAHVSFTRALAYFDLFLIAFNSVLALLLPIRQFHLKVFRKEHFKHLKTQYVGLDCFSIS